MIETISIVAGAGRDGNPDTVQRLDLRMGDIVAVVGPKSSGKTTLIRDIEEFSDGGVVSGRHILVNGLAAKATIISNSPSSWVALVSQRTAIASKLSVRNFVSAHARVRFGATGKLQKVLEKTLGLATELSGEAITEDMCMADLSVYQARAILAADAIVLCATPIMLLDEVEGPNVHSSRVIEHLRCFRKIFVLVTRDPRLALLSDCRIVMHNGVIAAVHQTSSEELALASAVGRVDDLLHCLRRKILGGERLTAEEWEWLAPVP